MLNDDHQRQQAIDPRYSFIVQAPAGSGKTEILTQRYLRLLSRVNAPEEIVALTFTRKAANEMRERILLALQQASMQSIATSPHQQQTLTFASEALKKNDAAQWQLLQQPNRLRIITIDALCQWLCQAIPLPDKQTPYAKISENPRRHYITAARACFNYALENSDYHRPLKILLQHVDNRQDTLLSLFSALLMKRDQWLDLLYPAKTQDKETYERALSWMLQHELSRFQQSIPPEIAYELTILARRVASLEPMRDSPRAPLRDWQRFQDLNPTILRSLASLLLTSQNTLRKAFDHHVGLKKGECSPNDYEEIKTASQQLLAELATRPEFLKALLRVKNLPSPHYDPEQWDVLQALFTLLPLLAGHLQLVFNEQNEVDFSSVSQQALLALGEEENPTDLALYLDNTIHHLLVDEFQDTSIQQYQLLSQLVQSFQPHDGKTLFVVGDPMQSIYRFRSAEVGLFLKAQHQGIGPVSLIPLELTCNFRSTATIVNWVNEQFKSIFPDVDDIESGAIRFHSSTPVKLSHQHSGVMAFAYEDRHQEAQALVLQILYELETYPDDNIAILVRSRTQLTDIMCLLREHKIPFQGIEIDHLAKLPHLRDVWCLTQALLMPSNRLTWLTVLRSPWCGLFLVDILCIASYAKHKSIYFALSQLNHIQGLTDEGRKRAHFIYTVLDKALIHRHRQSLAEWIMETLNELHLEQILDTAQQNDLDQFWVLLDRFEQQGYIENLALFNDEFNKLYSQRVTPSRLKIMTIHKSKGLEFDCVILPGLGAKSPNMDSPLLRWLKVPSQDHENRLLFSPMKAAHHDHCLLYDHLGKLDAEKNAYELQRLLYVAVTRAKKRLYLFDSNIKINKDTCRALLQRQSFLTEEKEVTVLSEATPLPALYRLPLEYYNPRPVASQNVNPIANLALTTPTSLRSAPTIYSRGCPRSLESNPVLDPANKSRDVVSGNFIIQDNKQRLTGIVIHELLQWICDYHPATIADIPWALTTHSLRALGFETQALHDTLYTLKAQLATFFNDPIGEWLIKPHDDEHNEYELLVENEGTLTTRIIDRTFVEQDIRWIIDFKTGHDSAHAQSHHRQQLSEYAQLFTRLGQETIRCGLYYLASNQWIAWEHNN